MPSIVLVRHGQASFGTSDYDVLSDIGHAQAAAVAAALQERGIRIDRVISGSLKRQLGTAEPIARMAGVEIEVDERWDEYASDTVLSHHADTDVRLDRAPDSEVPTISSRAFQDVLEAALLEWIAAGEGSPADVKWPAFQARVVEALRSAAEGVESGGTAIVATSGGPIAVACLTLLGHAPEALVTFNRVAINTGMSKIAVGRSGMTLISFNEHEHLEGEAARLLTYR